MDEGIFKLNHLIKMYQRQTFLNTWLTPTVNSGPGKLGTKGVSVTPETFWVN